MSTPYTDFVEPLRVLLRDNDPDIAVIETSELIAAIKMALNMGKVPGYAVSSGAISPDLTAADPTAYALLVYHAARPFVVNATRESFNTRGFSESIGAPSELIDLVIQELYKIENGEQIA
jgi:hypothetical protein